MTVNMAKHSASYQPITVQFEAFFKQIYFFNANETVNNFFIILFLMMLQKTIIGKI